MKSFKRIFLIVLGMIIGVAIVLFCIFNQAPVTVDFYIFQSGPLRLWFALLAALLIGIFTAGVFFVLMLFKYTGLIRRQNREIQQLNSELTYFRNLPLNREAYIAAGEEDRPEE